MKLFVASISTKILILKSLVVRNTYGFTLNSDNLVRASKTQTRKIRQHRALKLILDFLRRRTFRKTPPLHLKDCLVFLHTKTQMNNFWTHKLQKKRDPRVIFKMNNHQNKMV